MEDKGERGVCDGEESGNSSKGSITNPIGKKTGADTKLTSEYGSSNPNAISQLNYKDWEPKPELMKQLTGMGINKTVAKKALFCTGNNTAGKSLYIHVFTMIFFFCLKLIHFSHF